MRKICPICALLRSSAPTRAEVNAPCGWRSALAVHPRPMSPCTAPILVLTRSFVRSTGLPIPKVKGIGRSKKRKKLAPVAPTEPMPDKEGELIEDTKEEEEAEDKGSGFSIRGA